MGGKVSGRENGIPGNVRTSVLAEVHHGWQKSQFSIEGGMGSNVNVVISIDPGNAYTGMAMLVQGRPEEARMARVCMYDGDPVRSVRERVGSMLCNWIMVARHMGCACPVVLIERCPPTARKDANHGKQAQIGFALGWLSGLIAGYLMVATMNAIRIELVDVSEWRKGLSDDPLFMRKAQSLVAPVVEVVKVQQNTLTLNEGNTGFTRTWAGCGHRELLPRWMDLKTPPPAKCPICAIPVQNRAQIVRDEWKERACAYVSRVYPELFEAVVEEARKTAINKDKPVHELAGVADASEALCIARYGVKKYSDSVTD